jgi:hypothetical protein
MPSPNDFPTTGKVTAVKDDGIVLFVPRGTTYEMHLKLVGAAPPIGTPVDALIHVNARKVWTVPSGGNFLVPIMGPTKIVQGQVRYCDEKQLVVKAGANVIVNLPTAETAVDLPNGPIAVGQMVNVTALPGASVEFVSTSAVAATASATA